MTKSIVLDLVAAGGLGLAIWGLSLVYFPLAPIAAGTLAVACCVAIARKWNWPHG